MLSKSATESPLFLLGFFFVCSVCLIRNLTVLVEILYINARRMEPTALFYLIAERQSGLTVVLHPKKVKHYA